MKRKTKSIQDEFSKYFIGLLKEVIQKIEAKETTPYEATGIIILQLSTAMFDQEHMSEKDWKKSGRIFKSLSTHISHLISGGATVK